MYEVEDFACHCFRFSISRRFSSLDPLHLFRMNLIQSRVQSSGDTGRSDFDLDLDLDLDLDHSSRSRIDLSSKLSKVQTVNVDRLSHLRLRYNIAIDSSHRSIKLY